MIVGKFNIAKLKQDLADNGISLYQLAKLFQKHCPGVADAPTIYAWFARNKLPLERLLQIVAIARVETDRKFKIDDYCEYFRYKSKAA